MPVEFARAARGSRLPDLGAVAALARALYADRGQLGPVHEVYTRALRIAGPGETTFDPEQFEEQAEHDVALALEHAETGIDSAYSRDFETAIRAAAELAPVVARFFDEVLVMADDQQVRANRLRLLRAVAAAVGTLGDLAQLPL